MKVKKHEEKEASQEQKDIFRAIAVAQGHPNPEEFVTLATYAYEGKEPPKEEAQEGGENAAG